MAVEAKRGCGFRKVGGLYLVAPPLNFHCDRGVIPLVVCKSCGGGIKPSRGWTWINPRGLFDVHYVAVPDPTKERLRKALAEIAPGYIVKNPVEYCPDCKHGCFLCLPPSGNEGLLWIGDKFYSPDGFLKEAIALGVSRRIAAVPRGFELGKTIVYVAHRKAIKKVGFAVFGEDIPEPEFVPGIFAAFRPTAIEKIVTETEARDEIEMKRLQKQGITPVVVPHDDPDHRGRK